MAAPKKEPVKIRFKQLINGNKSIYLDIYAGGRRRYEFLKLYIIPEGNGWDKERNKVTMAQAEATKARRILEIQNGRFGVIHGAASTKIRLYDYLLKAAEDYEKGGTTYLHIHSVAKLVKEFGNVYLHDVDKSYLQGFIKFLSKYVGAWGKVLKGTTQQRRLASLITILNKAKRDGLIGVNPIEYISNKEKPKREPINRNYLTAEEIAKLAATTIRRGTIKKAFLFACFCGLRYSDIVGLKWAEIQDTGEGLQIVKQQKKTGEKVYIPLSANAVRWLPEKGESPYVFSKLPAKTTIQRHLDEWGKAADVNKHIYFHMSRHTCATLLLTYGADLYTVSKILGHTNINTTQIYAKVIDKKKAEAVNLIPTI